MFVLSVICILLLRLSSCSTKENKDVTISNQSPSQTFEAITDIVIEFPDTVYVNEKNSGIIKYKSVLDTITTSFSDKLKNRYVMLYLTLEIEPNNNANYIKENGKIFGAKNNREILIYDLIFTKNGTHFIDGIISDYVVIDLNTKDRQGSELVREIENEKRITLKVFVADRPSAK
jgi:hypothetical protein